MSAYSIELQHAKALVVDGNQQSRSIIVSQLRDAGVGTIVQCTRLSVARKKLGTDAYDVVITEQHFERESATGQALLDDLRSNQLLPFFTVFVMLTSESEYSKVAEAAESALDAYVLKPHTAAGLVDRIQLARERKAALQDIFREIDAEQLTEAARRCKVHFDERKPFWLYAARLGAELFLRTGQLSEAEKLFQAVVQSKTLPWAKLGVARAQLEAGYLQRAVSTLETLIETEPGYTDAYDVMGRAQLELGNFQSALNTFKTSTQLTPTSVNRLLKHGMMAWYAGEREEGIEMLDRATRIGLDSKLYDPQALVLLAFARLDNNDQPGLLRCVENLEHLRSRHPEAPRLPRLLDVVQTLVAIHDQRNASALEDVRRLAKTIHHPDFDFESASNLLGLLTRLAMRSIQLYEVDAAVDTMGLRFCTSRALTELLAFAAVGRRDFINRIRQAHSDILNVTESAMGLSLKGDSQAAVIQLLDDSERTRNAMIIESTHLVLQRYQGRIQDHAELQKKAEVLRERYRTANLHAKLADQAATGRAAGGLSISPGYKAPNAEGLLPKGIAAG